MKIEKDWDETLRGTLEIDSESHSDESAIWVGNHRNLEELFKQYFGLSWQEIPVTVQVKKDTILITRRQ